MVALPMPGPAVMTQHCFSAGPMVSVPSCGTREEENSDRFCEFEVPDNSG